MGGFTLGVYDSATGNPVNGATCSAFAFPLDLFGNPFPNPAGGRITKATAGNQGVAFDRTDFGIPIAGLGVEYHWDLNAPGFNGVAGFIRVPGDNWGHDVARMVAAPVPVVAAALPKPSETTTSQIVSANVAAAGSAIQDTVNAAAKTVAETITAPIAKPIAQFQKTVFIIGLVIVGIIVLVLFMPRSPAPVERVQVRKVRVGAVGFDPATRAVGVRDVEVAAR